jgi:cation/acetate symporter
MIGGLITTLFYLVNNYLNPNFTFMGLSHLSAGIFGMLVNFALTIVVSLATAPPPQRIMDLIEDLRNPVGEMMESGESGLQTH